ncbi:hypothetical protein RHGRI_008203 [Rhododendron griersonianum]|uniref:Cytochrome P450 n=1 Tax=Rhododendron griersonianum TaxID=479676 RepID=A0AAV6L0C3_9ERIC|nr:hypothetical protein RHGRI_008203 [Rhododendron griersonianum]
MEAPMLLLLLLLLLPLLAVGGGVVQNLTLLALALPLACLLFNHVWLKPQRVRWKLQKQGIRGPQPSVLYGNVPEIQRIQAAAKKAENGGVLVAHDYTSNLFPYLEQWRKEYECIFNKYRTIPEWLRRGYLAFFKEI